MLLRKFEALLWLFPPVSLKMKFRKFEISKPFKLAS
jgi:hypothetical protein